MLIRASQIDRAITLTHKTKHVATMIRLNNGAIAIHSASFRARTDFALANLDQSALMKDCVSEIRQVGLALRLQATNAACGSWFIARMSPFESAKRNASPTLVCLAQPRSFCSRPPNCAREMPLVLCLPARDQVHYIEAYDHAELISVTLSISDRIL